LIFQILIDAQCVSELFRYGYVDFTDADTAKKAQAELNGQDLGGRQVRLDFATSQPGERRTSRGGFGGSFSFSFPSYEPIILFQLFMLSLDR
jgi:RNA recognition motif-containing protein